MKRKQQGNAQRYLSGSPSACRLPASSASSTWRRLRAFSNAFAASGVGNFGLGRTGRIAFGVPVVGRAPAGLRTGGFGVEGAFFIVVFVLSDFPAIASERALRVTWRDWRPF